MFPLPHTRSLCHGRPFTKVSFTKYIMSCFQQKNYKACLKRRKPQFKKDEQYSDIPPSKRGSQHSTSEKNMLCTLFWHLIPFSFASHSVIYSFYRWLSVSFSGCVHACACLHISITQRTQRPTSTLSPASPITRLQIQTKAHRCCWTTDCCNSILIIRIKT